MIYWLFLVLGICTEVIGTTALRALVFDQPVWGMVSATLGISLSYYFVAKAIKKIPLGIAYAVWAGVGLAGISLLSAVLFDESMPPLKIFALGLILAGMIILNHDGRKMCGNNE